MEPLDPPLSSGPPASAEQTRPTQILPDLRELERRAMIGGLSLGMRELIASAMAVAAGIVLARTLDPAVFGIYAVITFVTRFFTQLSDVGLGAALIRKPELRSRDLTTAFFLQQALLVFAVTLVWSSASLWAAAYDIEQAAPMIRVLALALWAASLGSIPSLMLEREMRFRSLALADLSATSVYHGLAVILALSGYEVWSFVLAALARSVTGAIVLNVVFPWRPRFAFDTEAAGQLIAFGLPFQLNKVIALVKDNITPTLVASLSGVAAVGYLNWAQTIAYLPLAVMPILARVTFPAYSRLQGDPETLRKAIEKSFRLLALGLYPGAFLLVALAPEIVRFVYTDRWRPALPAFYLFSVVTLWAVVSYPITNALYALGRAGVVLKLNVVWTIAAWGASIPLVAVFDWPGYALAMAIVSQMAVMAIWELRKLVAVRVLRWIALPLACSAVMGLGVRLTASRLVAGIPSLVAVAVLGLVLYATLVIVAGGRSLAEELKALLSMLPWLDRATRVLRRAATTVPNAVHRRLYHDREREELIRKMIAPITPRRSLEIGCGPGRLPGIGAPGMVVLADHDRKALTRLARAWAGRSRPYHFVVSDAAALPFRDSSFDHVAVLDVLEHVPEQGRAAREIEAVLAPGGSIIFFGPGDNWRFPYHRWMRPFALPEADVLELWGHRHRGYSAEDLLRLFPSCRGEELVRYHEGALAFRVDVEFSRLPFAIKVILWVVGDLYYRVASPFRVAREAICLGMRLSKRTRQRSDFRAGAAVGRQ